MRNTTHLSLNVWSNADDPYDHTQLAANWDLIDADDHSSHPISATGLQSNAVTTPKIANQAVTRAKIDPTVLAGLQAPLGTMTPFFRPVDGIAIPTGYAIADGSTLGVGAHDWGSFSVTLPDLRNKFVLGAAVTGTGTTTSTPPAELALGGQHTRDLSGHTHTVGGHYHSVTLPNHSHTISNGGSHLHNGFVGMYLTMGLGAFEKSDFDGIEDNAMGFHNLNGETRYADRYYPRINRTGSPVSPEGADMIMETAGVHNHGGSTGSGGSATVDTGSSGTQTTSNATGMGTDFRPAYIGLLWIVKVKNA